jgi:hypothetical protein
MRSYSLSGLYSSTPATSTTAEVLSSRHDVLGLAASASHLLQHYSASATPAFFLASIDARAWIPRVVVVRKGNSIRGFLYAKERKFAGLPSGLVYADLTLGSVIVSAERDIHEILRIAIERLTQSRRVQGLRILGPKHYRSDVSLTEIQTVTGMDVGYTDIEYHCLLTLPSNYETFLTHLGFSTRQNFRRYRRRLEAAGGHYVAKMKREDFEAAALSLFRKNVVGAKSNGLERALRMFRTLDRPILAGLRDSQGNWLAIVGGWYEAHRAVILCQMNNDVDFPQSSLCTVLRGYLFESLIAESVDKVVFWAGLGGPLLRHCEYLPASGMYFDRPTLTWRFVRKALSALMEFLPRQFAPFVHWVSPMTGPPGHHE